MSSNKNQKILFAVSDISKDGGIQRFNFILVKSLLELNCNVILICLTSDKLPAKIEKLIMKYKSLDFYPCSKNKIFFIYMCLMRCIFDKPRVAICGHLNQVIPLSIIFYLARVKRMILVLHGIEVWERVGSLKSYFSNLFTCILSVSTYTRESFMRQAAKVSGDKCLIFPNTVENRFLEDDRSSSIPRANKSLLSVTRLDKTERDKGIIDTLDALNILGRSDIEYNIVGDGDDKAYLYEYMMSLNLECIVNFHGRVPDDELKKIYRDSDIFILPSRKEGFGIVYLEAMMYKKPVIGAAEKGVLDVISDYHNGFKVEFGDKEELARVINKLISDSELCETLGNQGYCDVTGNGKFSYESYKKRVRQMILGSE